MAIYITRKFINKKPVFYNSKNKKEITNSAILNKIKKIYIAPAYTNVKIYLDKPLLATGIDKAGRTQYIYSDDHKKGRELRKYCQLVMMSKNIVKLQKSIKNDLLGKEMTKRKIIALILKIMDLCNFRSGSKLYETKYGSHGLTTLHKKHVSVLKKGVKIKFVGKKGVVNECLIKDSKIQDILKEVYNSEGDDKYLFSYRKEHIKIGDINNYLNKFKITSKDLRTWNANIIFLKNLDKDLNIKEAIKKTAISLHHTPYICRNSYIYKNLITIIQDNKSIYNEIKRLGPEKFLKDILRKDANLKSCNK